LNEFLPFPKTSYTNEWIEIANDGDAPANLAGWSLDDEEGGGAPYQLPRDTRIAPHELLVVKLPKALLNNSGDSVRLLRPDGSVADRYQYGQATPDRSFCLIEREWRICTPTLGQANRAETTPSDQPQAFQLPTVEQIADAPAIIASVQQIAGRAPQLSAAPALPAWSVDHTAQKIPYALATSGTLYQALSWRTPTVQPAESPPALSSSSRPTPTSMLRPADGGHSRSFSARLGMFLVAIGGAAAGYDRLRMRFARPTGQPTPVEEASIDDEDGQHSA